VTGSRPSAPRAERTVRCLSFHAEYVCRDAGVCCTSGWPIPIEPDRLAGLRTAMAAGRMLPRGVAPDAVLLPVVNNECAFYDGPSAHHCAIHRALGHEALPLACRQFPRVSLSDPRGVSVTLSHYCPTAAALLETAVDVSISASPRSFPIDAEYVGLDAAASLPPLLHPGMLMDWPAWWAFEAQAVDLLAHGGDSAADAMARLETVVEALRRWSPQDGSLGGRVTEAFAEARAREGVRSSFDADARWTDLVESIPAAWRPRSFERRGCPSDAVRRRLLAAHAFANWTAQLGRGLRTWLRSLHCVQACLTAGLDAGETDLLLRHLVDPQGLAGRLGKGESL